MQTRRRTHALFLHRQAASRHCRCLPSPVVCSENPLLLHFMRNKKEKKPHTFLLKSKIACSASIPPALYASRLQRLSRAATLCALNRVCFLLIGEPSRSRRDGNHSPDIRGHIWTYICHGREPRIPHKGSCELPSGNVCEGHCCNQASQISQGSTCVGNGQSFWQGDQPNLWIIDWMQRQTNLFLIH